MLLDAIHAMLTAEAARWCNDVRRARKLLRTKAAQAERTAQRANAARKNSPHPGQWGLFEGGAAA